MNITIKVTAWVNDSGNRNREEIELCEADILELARAKVQDMYYVPVDIMPQIDSIDLNR